MYRKLHRKYSVFTIFSIMILWVSMLFTGCGSQNQELENYKVNMNQFFENIKIYNDSINNIDPQSDTAVSDLLALLDSLDTSFAQMASLTVPDGFPGVDQLAAEASENMSQAVSYYHQAFEGEEYDASLADVAKQYYDRANVRLQYIVSILHGDIPEEIYTYEDDSENTKDSSDSSSEDSSQTDPGTSSEEADPAEENLTEVE